MRTGAGTKPLPASSASGARSPTRSSSPRPVSSWPRTVKAPGRVVYVACSWAILPSVLVAGRARPGESAEDRADRHAEPGEVSLAQDAASHNLAGGVDILERRPIPAQHASGPVHRHAQVREGDADPQRVAVVRRAADGQRPRSEE